MSPTNKLISYKRNFFVSILMILSKATFAQDSAAVEPTPVEQVQQPSYHSVMDLKTGTYKFGETTIDLKSFHKMNLPEGWYKKISFRSDLVMLARIKTNGRSEREIGDTLWIKQSKSPVSKKALLKYKTQKDRNPYDWYSSQGRGIGSHCPPGQCYHYFLAYTTKGEWIEIRDSRDLLKILPKIKNEWDALFLTVSDIYAYEPILASSTTQGWHILMNSTISDCPITYADKLFAVNNKGGVEELGLNINKITNLCY